MNEQSDPLKIPRHTALIKLGVASLVLLLLMAGFKGYRDLTYVKGQEAALEAKIQATQERIDGLKAKIGRIRHDPASLEQIAREELAWVRDGDVVIVLPEGNLPEATVPQGNLPEATVPEGNLSEATRPEERAAPPR